MADQEIAKHTKKVFDIVTHKEHTAWHKVREIALEIVVIVFAVSLSIWLHGLGEHRHEQQQVKTFLIGLKHDLESDIEQVKDIIVTNHSFDANYAYLASLDPAAAIKEKEFDAAYTTAVSNIWLIPHMSRYDGFKTSGKLSNIEDDALLDDIASLYQQDLRNLQNREQGWLSSFRKLSDFLDSDAEAPDTREHRYKMLTSAKGQRLCKAMLLFPEQRYERYQAFVARARRIIDAIDLSYPEQAAKAGKELPKGNAKEAIAH